MARIGINEIPFANAHLLKNLNQTRWQLSRAVLLNFCHILFVLRATEFYEEKMTP